MRILLAVDDSETSARAVKYVGSLLRGSPDTEITLFHVLKPMPRGLLEHGGSENPAAETKLGEQLRQDQQTWIREESESECPVLIKARETLTHSGFDRGRVELRIGHEEDVDRNILEEGRSGKHDTIVVGRHGASRVKRLFGGGVTDQILRDAEGFAVWVVE